MPSTYNLLSPDKRQEYSGNPLLWLLSQQFLPQTSSKSRSPSLRYPLATSSDICKDYKKIFNNISNNNLKTVNKNFKTNNVDCIKTKQCSDAEKQ